MRTGEIPAIIKKYVAPDHLLIGDDVAALKKLDVIVSPRNGAVADEVLHAMAAAVSSGVGLLNTMGLDSKSDNPDVENLNAMTSLLQWLSNREVD